MKACKGKACQHQIDAKRYREVLEKIANTPYWQATHMQRLAENALKGDG